MSSLGEEQNKSILNKQTSDMYLKWGGSQLHHSYKRVQMPDLTTSKSCLIQGLIGN